MYRIVVHLQDDTFHKIQAANMTAVAVYLGNHYLGSEQVVSVAVFKGEKMIQFQTPIRDPALIEKGGEQLRGPHFRT